MNFYRQGVGVDGGGRLGGGGGVMRAYTHHNAQ